MDMGHMIEKPPPPIFPGYLMPIHSQAKRLLRTLTAACVGRLPGGGARQAQAGFKPCGLVQQQGHWG